MSSRTLSQRDSQDRSLIMSMDPSSTDSNSSTHSDQESTTINSRNGSFTTLEKSVAVVGSGISGLATAYFLNSKFKVTLLESESRLGGHSYTVTLPNLPPIDLGFQVFNLTTYPNLVSLLKELDVDTRPSSMSFSASVDLDGRTFEWASWGLHSIFPTWRSIAEWERWILLYDAIRFGRSAPADASRSTHDLITGEYLKTHRYSQVFITAYLQPMIAAIWSVPNATALQMPFKTLVQFMSNHHLLSTGYPPRPTWRVLNGRAKEYVEKIADSLPDIRLSTAITKVVERSEDGVLLQDEHGESHRFDLVVFATHSDTTLSILGDQATELEREILSPIKYQENHCILHTDPSFMPTNRSLWTSWNALDSEHEKPVMCTYWVNLLQNISPTSGVPDIFLTLNPTRRPDGILGEYHLSHPVLSAAAVKAQRRLPSTQGKNNTYFAGAWTRFGFHEDGLLSAIKVATELGWERPWKLVQPSPVPDLKGFVSFKVVERVLQNGITRGQMRVILPRGNEVVFPSSPATPMQKPAIGLKPVTTTMRVHDLSTFTQILKGGATGLAEAYMDGLFDVDGDLENLTALLCLNHERLEHFKSQLGPLQAITSMKRSYLHLWRSRNSLSSAKGNITAHYDMGNAMYRLFLDKHMQYSSAEFEKGDSLDQAQCRKMNSVLQQLDVRTDHHVLEIGCGWGGLAVYAVQKFGCRWTGITLSPAQKDQCDANVAAAGLAHKISIFLLDYRELPKFYNQSFDRVVSIEMIEAVGHANLPLYYETVDKVLKKGGKTFVQAITIPDERYELYRKSSDFIKDYIFPGGHLPCMNALSDAVTSGSSLHLCSARSLGSHYATTLRIWRARFTSQLDTLSSLNYSDRFKRMFLWYFVYCESAFKYELIDVKQLTYEKREALKDDKTLAKDPAIAFDGRLIHTRFEGLARTFNYPASMIFVEVTRLARTFKDVRWMSVNKPNLLSIYRRDYGGDGKLSFEDSIRSEISRQHNEYPKGPIYLLTTAKALGYSFNPLSVFYVFDDRSCRSVSYLILEVTNTPWNEVIRYIVKPTVDEWGRLNGTFRKEMHVSPFFGMDYTYHINASLPTADGINITIRLIKSKEVNNGSDAQDASQPAFTACLDLQRAGSLAPSKYTDDVGWLVFMRMLFMPFIMQLWINHQALKLVANGQPLFKVPHPDYEKTKITTIFNYVRDLIKHLGIFGIAILASMFLWAIGVSVEQKPGKSREKTKGGLKVA